jgi:hypothetical protein
MKKLAFIPLCLIGLMFACTPATKLQKSWIDPSFNATNTKPFTKVLVVAPLKDEASQRIAEDKIVSQLKQGVGVPSYAYLNIKDADQKVVDAMLIKDGFDGVIVMRLKEVEKTTSYIPGTVYSGWYGYRSYSPGYYSQDKTFMVETNFYSLKENKLFWSGTTTTLNPTSLERSMDQIIAANKFELQKKGLLKK